MINIEIFKLFGSVFVDNEKANKSIAKTDKKAEGLAARFGKGVKTAAKWGAGIATAGAAAGAALFATANKAAGATDRIDKMSQKLGMSRKGFQELDYVLSQNGTSIDSMKGGMKTLTNQLDDMGKGGKIATDAFGELGLSYDDLRGKSQEEVFRMTISALQNVEDETKRAAIANDLLGRSGQELAPLLNAGAGSMEELTNKAHELGIVISDEAIDSGVQFTDTMDSLKRSFGAVFTQVGTALIPILQQLSEWIITNMPTIQAVVSTVFGVIAAVISKIGDIMSTYVIPALQAFWDWIEPHLPAIQLVFETVFTVIGIILKGFIDGIKLVIQWVQQWADDNQETLDAIHAMFKAFFDFISALIGAYVEWAKAFWQAYGEDIIEIFSNIWQVIKTIFQTAINIITDIFNIFAALFRGDWEGLWEGVKALFADIWNGIVNILKAALELLQSVFKFFGDILYNIWSGIWEGIKSLTIGIVTAIKDFITGILNAIKDFITNILNTIKNVITNSLNDVKNTVTTVSSAIKTIITAAWNAIKSVTETIFNGIKRFFINIFRAIKSIFTTSTRGIKDITSQAWKAIANLTVEIFSNMKDFIFKIFDKILDKVFNVVNKVKSAMNKIKHAAKSIGNVVSGKSKSVGKASPPTGSGYASGTNYATRGWHLVGEKGPELLNFKGGEKVISNKNMGRKINAGRNITQNVTINSPTALSPSEIARQNKRVLQELALQF